MTLVYTPNPTLNDCDELVRLLRQADRNELTACVGPADHAAHMAQSIAQSLEAYTVRTLEGHLVCLFGINPGHEVGVGVPWLLGTDMLDRRMFSLCRTAKEIIARWHQTYPFLINMTDKRNRRVLLWLRWLGFRLGDEILVGPERTPFIIFSRLSHHV